MPGQTYPSGFILLNYTLKCTSKRLFFFFVFQIVTNRGLMSVSWEANRYLEETQQEYWCPNIPAVVLPSTSKYWRESPICDKLKDQKRILEVNFVLIVYITDESFTARMGPNLCIEIVRDVWQYQQLDHISSLLYLDIPKTVMQYYRNIAKTRVMILNVNNLLDFQVKMFLHKLLTVYMTLRNLYTNKPFCILANWIMSSLHTQQKKKRNHNCNRLHFCESI